MNLWLQSSISTFLSHPPKFSSGCSLVSLFDSDLAKKFQSLPIKNPVFRVLVRLCEFWTMVGGICVVGSPIVDSHTSPCLCIDTLISTHMNHTSNGDLNLQRKSISKKLRSSFTDSRLPSKAIASKKQKRVKSFVIVNDLGGQYEESFHDVKSVRTCKSTSF